MSETVIDSIAEVLQTAGPALVGVLVGWALSEWSSRRRLSSEVAKQQQSLAVALKTEIETFLERYMCTVGRWIESAKDNDFLGGYVIIRESTFSVFESNADKIGLLPPSEARDLVRFYATAKDHLDALRTYENEYNRTNYVRVPPAERQTILVAYTKTLRQRQRELLAVARSAMTALQRYV